MQRKTQRKTQCKTRDDRVADAITEVVRYLSWLHANDRLDSPQAVIELLQGVQIVPLGGGKYRLLFADGGRAMISVTE